MTIAELYEFLNERIPPSLSCEWDNDGLMCCPDPDREVSRVLIALDVTEEIVQRAIQGEYDLIVSHHPLVFRPLKSITPYSITADKLITLIKSDVSVMSFHTRLDAVTGGVNDILAELLGMVSPKPFGDEGLGRIGTLERPMKFRDFVELVKELLGCEAVEAAYAGRMVHNVAVLGGSGSSEIAEAKRAGADTYLTGELSYHNLCDAKENGVNLIAAGHFHTENPVCDHLAALISEADELIEIDIESSLRYEIM